METTKKRETHKLAVTIAIVACVIWKSVFGRDGVKRRRVSNLDHPFDSPHLGRHVGKAEGRQC